MQSDIQLQTNSDSLEEPEEACNQYFYMKHQSDGNTDQQGVQTFHTTDTESSIYMNGHVHTLSYLRDDKLMWLHSH